MPDEVKGIQDTFINGGARIVPRHIAVIPDGNRRWARKRGLPPIAGHREGVETYRKLLKACADRGVKYVTFYAFSTENWKRSDEEVSGLMKLLVKYMKNFDSVMGKNKSKVRFIVSGDRTRLSSEVQEGIAEIEEATKNNTDLTAVICVNYGGRDEIVHAARKLAEEAAEGKIDPGQIDEEAFAARLYADVPDPDLLIRTSGEMRLSNFLLWQLAYAEFCFADCYWPDFDEKMLDDAIDDFSSRQRRFGN